jgi:hypothetical protein
MGRKFAGLTEGLVEAVGVHGVEPGLGEGERLDRCDIVAVVAVQERREFAGMMPHATRG